MYPVSSTYLSTLTSADQHVIFQADVLSGGTLVKSGLNVTGGSVTVDGTANVRRRCSVTIVDDTGALIPTGSADVLSPYGYEVRLWRGFGYKDGTTELVPVGTFRISSAKTTDDTGRSIALDGYDRSRAVSRARFEQPYSIDAGTNYATALQALIADRLPGTVFSSIQTLAVTPLLLFDEAADPWAVAQTMANSFGAEVFFDPLGVCVIRIRPDSTSDPVTYTYAEGANATVLAVTNNLTDDSGYNGVVVDGEVAGGAPPVHSVIYDVDPTSPTYSAGRYGKVPTFLKSQYITTQAQADDAAAAVLRSQIGGTQALSFSCVPNPAHEAGDTVRVTRAAMKVDDLYLLESFAIPLDVTSAMSPVTRKRATA